jgi:hypothetical protein
MSFGRFLLAISASLRRDVAAFLTSKLAFLVQMQFVPRPKPIRPLLLASGDFPGEPCAQRVLVGSWVALILCLRAHPHDA